MAEIGAPAATATERALLEIWAEVLGVDELAGHSDFFELGGQSRQAMQIAARAQEAFGVELAADAVFHTPTIAGLARSLETARAETPRGAAATSRPSEPVLSPGQKELWCSQAYSPGLRPHSPRVYRLTGQLDVDALQRALGEVARRHESLRTVFPDDLGRPRAVVLPPEQVSIPVTDLVDLPRREREEEASRRVTEAMSGPFELATRPPWRGELLRLEPNVHVFALVLHEIVCDGWSLGVLFQELSVLYACFAAGRPADLPELPLQYSEAAARIERDRAVHDDYWKRTVSDAPLALALPWETAGRPAHRSEKAQRARRQRTAQVTSQLSSRLEALARQESVTGFMVHLAAFFALLHRYSGETDLVVVSPSTNRPSVELEGLIGFFARNVPLRMRLDGDPSFRTLLGSTRKAVLDASAHARSAPLYVSRLIDADGPRGLRRGLSVGFRTQSATDNPLGDSFDLPNLRTEPLDDGRAPGTHWWLWVSDLPGRTTTVDLAYEEDVPDDSIVDRMARGYVAILESAADDPDTPVSGLKVLSHDDRSKLVTKWRHKPPREASSHSLDGLVAAQAARTPDAVAVSSAAGDLTYRELIGYANRLAGHLHSRGMAAKGIVGLSMDPSPEMVAAILGILKVGCACVPIPGDGSRIAGEGVDLDALVVNGAAPGVAGAAVLTVDLDRERGEIDAAPGGDPDRSVDPDDPALVVRTAGVTGPPKAALLTHRAVVAGATWSKRLYRLAASDRALHLPGTGGLTWALTPWACLAGGGTVVVPDGLGDDEPIAGIAEWLGRRGVTVASLTPRIASALLRFGAGDQFSLRMVMVAGAGQLELPEAGVDRRLKVVRQYALAETGGAVMSAFAAPAPAACAPVAVGTPASANASAFVLDRHLNLAPIGAAGDLYLGGATLASGYAGAPRLTEEAFIPDHLGLNPGGRLLRTGDLARRRLDGAIELLGRRHDEVAFRGFRLTPRLVELETALRAHAAVRAAATAWDSEHEEIVAYVVLSDESAPSATSLDAWIRQSIRDALLPERYEVVDDLPIRADGSPDRQALADLPSRPVDARDGRTRPRTRRERRLASIWRELLNRDDVGVHDSFFRLGGDPTLGVEMIARAMVAGIQFPPQTLLTSPTISELAEAAGDAPREAEGPGPTRGRLAFWQRRAGR